MTSKNTALAQGVQDGEHPVVEAKNSNTKFAIVLPHLRHGDAQTVIRWPVEIRFPSVADAMRLLASAKRGTEIDGATSTPKFLSVAEYARHRRISKRSVETLIKRGLPLDGRGRLRRVPVREADRWMAEQGGAGLDNLAKAAARKTARNATADDGESGGE